MSNQPINITVSDATVPPASIVPFTALGENQGIDIQSRFHTDITPEMMATKVSAEVEKAIRIQLKKDREAANIVLKKLQALEKTRRDFLTALPRQLLTDLSERFVMEMHDPYEISASATYKEPSYDQTNQTVSLPVYFVFDRNTSFTKTYTRTAPEELRNLQADIENAEEALRDAQLKVRTTNSALLNIGSIEREARANVITKIMESSAEGKKLLSTFDTIDVDAAVSYLQAM